MQPLPSSEGFIKKKTKKIPLPTNQTYQTKPESYAWDCWRGKGSRSSDVILPEVAQLPSCSSPASLRRILVLSVKPKREKRSVLCFPISTIASWLCAGSFAAHGDGDGAWVTFSWAMNQLMKKSLDFSQTCFWRAGSHFISLFRPFHTSPCLPLCLDTDKIN